MADANIDMRNPPGWNRKFRVVKEGWSIYRIPSHDIEVSIRIIPLWVVELDPKRAPKGAVIPEGQLAIQAPIFTVLRAERLGTPALRPPEMSDYNKRGVHVRYEVEEDFENEYLLIGGGPERGFSVRVVVSGMRILPSWCDPAGNPYVHVQAGMSPSLAHPLLMERSGNEIRAVEGELEGGGP